MTGSEGRPEGEPIRELDGSALAVHLADTAARPRRARRAHAMAGRVGWLATSVAVLGASVAVAQGGDGGGGAETAGNSPGEAVQIQVRNRSRGETGLVTSSDDYSLRLSNTKEGGGGGAVYGCRAATATPAEERACLYADNLRGGEAFLFRSRQGTKVGHFDLGNPAGAPFSTNATGMVANLNADRLDSLHASEIVSQSRAKAGLDAETADTATNSTQLGGKGPASYQIQVATDSSDTNSSITTGVNIVLSATVTTTVPTRIVANSNVEVDADGGNNDDAFCYQNKGATGTGADDISQRVTVDIPDTNLDRGNIANHGTFLADPGTHTIRVFCGVNVAGQTIMFDSGDMNVLAIPTT